MATNDFEVFAGSSSDTYTPSDWHAMTALLENGFVAGVASTTQMNTLMRQVSTVAAGVAEFIKGQGVNAVDDGNLSNFAAAFLSAIQLSQAAVVVVPSGIIVDFGSETPPTGWLECDGSSLLRASYPALFAAIGTVHGSADGTHFNIPDYRGKFRRGWNHGTGNDPDASSRTAAAAGGATGDHVGTVQGWQLQSHTHTVTVENRTGSSNTVGNGGGGTYGTANTINYTGGNQTNPINAAVMAIIKI